MKAVCSLSCPCDPQLPMPAHHVRSNLTCIIKEVYSEAALLLIFFFFSSQKAACCRVWGTDKLFSRSSLKHLPAVLFFPLSKHQMRAVWADCHPSETSESLCVSGPLTHGVVRGPGLPLGCTFSGHPAMPLQTLPKHWHWFALHWASHLSLPQFCTDLTMLAWVNFHPV